MADTTSRRPTKAGRFYEIVPGDPWPSVTTILQVLNKPALVPWAAKMERLATIDAAADMFEEWKGPLKVTSTITRDVYCSLLEARIGKKKASQKELETAGEIGTQAHALIEWHIAGLLGQKQGTVPKVHDKATWAFMAFEDWARKQDMLPIRSEQVVFSHKHRYAGTMDLLAYLGADRRIALTDFKTGKAIYSEAYLQVAAYRQALIEMGLEVADECWILRLPKNENDPEFEAKLIPDLDKHFKAFLSASELWTWQYNESQKKEKV